MDGEGYFGGSTRFSNITGHPVSRHDRWPALRQDGDTDLSDEVLLLEEDTGSWTSVARSSAWIWARCAALSEALVYKKARKEAFMQCSSS